MSTLPDGSVPPHAPAAAPDDDAPLPAFEDRAPPDRFCDLVLTGGVTSSIAYPALLLTLASSFRFHSIGGSSSGAGAAALAAAAEYRRRHGSSEGFRILLERTAEVRRTVDGRTTRLRTLFQPWAHSRRLFEALVPVLTQPELSVRGLAAALARAYLLGQRLAAACLGAGALLAAAGLVLTLAAPAGWPRMAPLALIAGAALGVAGACVAGLALARDLRRLIDDDFGLCSGSQRLAPDSPAPLTEWLHGLIQEIAGRTADGPPLTFADLRDAPASPRAMGQGGQEMDGVSIRLQVYAANVTLGRPLVLPLRASDEPLFFRPREMHRLFPASVVRAMMRQRRDGAPPGQPDDEDALWRLPDKELPIVVAARMSVSAPLLFSPVPVWMDDAGSGPPVPRRCLLSDGGLCSNFPIHLFDCAVPAWPTFGVSLHDAPRVPGAPVVAPQRMTPEDIRAAVDLPGHPDAMPRQPWQRFGDEPSPWQRAFGFLAALLWTAKDWNDALLARMPGVRDRIVRVALPPGIGGLNICMTPDQIQSLSDLGREAGRRLLERFARPALPDGTAAGWAEHRWVRLHLLREGLAELLAGASAAAAPGPYGPSLAQQVRAAQAGTPLRGDDAQRLLAAQAAALEGTLAALRAAEAALGAPQAAPPYQPRPQPMLRLRPPL